MTKLIPAFKRAALILWAFAVLWIYIGSLVNFHQHKIWGRPLLPQLLFCKRDKEKSFDLLHIDPASGHTDFNPDLWFIQSGLPCITDENIHNPSGTVIFAEPFAFNPGVSEGAEQLRAPPVA